MAINFPSAPTEGQYFNASGNLWFTYTGGKWRPETGMAQQANLLVNGSMQTSQENGSLGSSNSGWYVADQWQQHNSGITNYAQGERFDFKSVKGSKYRFRTFFWAAKSSWASGEHLMAPYQVLEGNSVAQLCWGTTEAKPIVVRFWLYAPQGTYGFCVRNYYGAPRSFVTTMVVSAGQHNTNHERIFAIPGDITGRWDKDTQAAMQVNVTLGCGTEYRTSVLNGWQDGNFLGPSTIKTNFALAELFEFQDIGLYVDPNYWGRPPPYEIQPESTAMRHAMRYWYKMQNGRGQATAATFAARVGSQHPVKMRTNAALGISGAPTLNDIATNNALTSLVGTYPNQFYPEFEGGGSGMTMGRAAIMVTDAGYLAVDAR